MRPGFQCCANRFGTVESFSLCARHDGFNALHAAITTPYTDDLVPFVSLLLEYGANVNVKTTAGRLPLDLLAHARTLPASEERIASLDMCEALLRNAGGRETVP